MINDKKITAGYEPAAMTNSDVHNNSPRSAQPQENDYKANAQLIFDQEAMKRHIDFLYDGMSDYDDGRFEIAILNAGEHFSLDEKDKAVEKAIYWNKQGKSIYLIGALLDPEIQSIGRASDDDFYATNVIWCDIDHEISPDDLAEKYKHCPPALIVVTGRRPYVRTHLWWKLDEPVSDADTLREALTGVQQHLGGDPAVKNPTSLMRVGGSINFPSDKKRAAGRIAEKTEIIFTENYQKINIESFLAAYPAQDFQPLHADAGAQDAPSFDASGKMHDGRENYMHRLLTAVIVNMTAKKGAWPQEDDVFNEAWPTYAEKVTTKAGRTLDQDGRGQRSIRQKIKGKLRNFKAGRIPGARTVEEIKERKKEKLANETAILNGLIERAAAEHGEAFKPEVKEALSKLKREDRAAFETLRSKLKNVGVRVGELDKAMRQESDSDNESDPAQADILVDLAGAANLFHTPDSTAYADFEVNAHRETWHVRSKGFKRWLTRRYYEETKKAPNSEALNSALSVIEAKAHYDAPERDIFIRIAGYDGKIYIDLCNEKWEAVEIDEHGWRVVNDLPIRFRRTGGMLPLATPQEGGSIQALRKFLNVKDDGSFVLAVSWLLAALRNTGPYPVLCLSGEQGSAKSFFMNILRRLNDPNTAPLRTLPREDRDLFIAANNGYVLAFDNLSKMPDWISDTLCRLATGGGFATRALYTDGEESLFNAMRPIILNGIEDFVTRPDLGDRSILMILQQIPEENRKSEEELNSEFDKEMPLILGALLDAVAHGLKKLPSCILEKKPRMADFALWGMACETAFWKAGTFISAYEQNRTSAVSAVLDGDATASAVQIFMEKQSRDLDGRTIWTGTASDLLAELGKVTAENVQKSPAWPKTPRALSGQLRRIAPFLRKNGVVCDLDFKDTDTKRSRLIKIKGPLVNEGNSSSAPSRPSGKEAFIDIPWDDADGLDAKIPPLSGHDDAEIF